MAQYFCHFKVILFPHSSSSPKKMQENKIMIYLLNKAGDGVDVAMSLEKAHRYSTIQSGEFQL